MWGLSTHLPELLQVIDAWGFTLKTKAWTWVKMTKNMEKNRIGMGYWTRQVSEDCWLATKGKPHRPEWKGEPAIIETCYGDNSVIRLLSPLEQELYCLTAEFVGDTLRFPRHGLRHSEKSAEQYAKIDRLFPHLTNRLEMFAREKRDGYDVFGNEVADSIDLGLYVNEVS